MRPQFNFIITHSVTPGGNHVLEFKPSVAVQGYKPKTIEVTEEQWNELRYHFMLAIDDNMKIERLSYI